MQKQFVAFFRDSETQRTYALGRQPNASHGQPTMQKYDEETIKDTKEV